MLAETTAEERRDATHPSTAVRIVKRGVDVVVAGAAVVLTAPLLVALLLASAAVFRANPLFVQHRVGRHGRSIPVPKVRSIPADAPRAADKRELALLPIPPWGRFLRRSHLDELPQLWAVLMGDMSLVGPRPEMGWLAERFEPDFARLRVTVRPGITGLWQVSDGADGLIVESPEYDAFYVRHMGLRFDLWLMWRTVRMVLPGASPVTSDDLRTWTAVPVAELRPGARHLDVAGAPLELAATGTE